MLEPRSLADLAVAWRGWEAFADHHRLDPAAPDDADVVAFVQARMLVGVGYPVLARALHAIGLVAGDRAVAAARRYLADLHGEGVFDAAWQAPVLTLGQCTTMRTVWPVEPCSTRATPGRVTSRVRAVSSRRQEVIMRA